MFKVNHSIQNRSVAHSYAELYSMIERVARDLPTIHI